MSAFGQSQFGRSFAPGLEPGFWDRVVERFASLPIPPDLPLLIAAMLIPAALAGVAAARIRRRRRADEGLRRARIAADLAEMRRARTAEAKRIGQLVERR